MFTIIVCSIRPKEAENLRKNIEATIGVPFEFLAYDNRGTGKGICQVYNECAERAKYDYLCFAHEDIEFLTDDWGKKIAEKLQEKDCGVIGFAGSTMKSKFPSGWSSTSRYGLRMNMVQVEYGNDCLHQLNPYDEDFSKVVTADGLCLFTSKKTWNEVRFDEKNLKGFHCYDVDYSLGLFSAGYRNYICHKVLVKHTSLGNHDVVWLRDNLKLHKKWDKHLPMYVNKDKSRFYRNYLEFMTSVEWTYIMSRNSVYESMQLKHVLRYIATHPTNGRSYKMLVNYLKYRRSAKTISE